MFFNLEEGDAAPGGRGHLEGRLQRGAEGGLRVVRRLKHRGQRVQQLLDERATRLQVHQEVRGTRQEHVCKESTQVKMNAIELGFCLSISIICSPSISLTLSWVGWLAPSTI